MYSLLIDYLPEFYYESREVIALQEAISGVIDALRAAVEAMLDRCFVREADQRGVDLWMRDFGIASNDPIDQQREMILAKMRQRGTCTPQFIAQMMAAFECGEVQIIELESGFIVKFISRVGVPKNMGDVAAVIEESKPAHLHYEFAYIYFTWGMYEGYTFGEVGKHTFKELNEGVNK